MSGFQIPDADATPGLADAAPVLLQRHLHVVASIAEEMQRSIQEVLPLYDEVLQTMSSSARITDYLPIFVSRRVRHLLGRQS